MRGGRRGRGGRGCIQLLFGCDIQHLVPVTFLGIAIDSSGFARDLPVTGRDISPAGPDADGLRRGARPLLALALRRAHAPSTPAPGPDQQADPGGLDPHQVVLPHPGEQRARLVHAAPERRRSRADAIDPSGHDVPGRVLEVQEHPVEPAQLEGRTAKAQVGLEGRRERDHPNRLPWVEGGGAGGAGGAGAGFSGFALAFGLAFAAPTRSWPACQGQDARGGRAGTGWPSGAR